MNKRVVLIILLGAVLLVVVLFRSTMSLRRHRVEVCLTYNSRTQCKVASGPTRFEAIQTAVQNVCGVLAGGVTDSGNCQRTPPDSVRDLE